MEASTGDGRHAAAAPRRAGPSRRRGGWCTRDTSRGPCSRRLPAVTPRSLRTSPRRSRTARLHSAGTHWLLASPAAVPSRTRAASPRRRPCAPMTSLAPVAAPRPPGKRVLLSPDTAQLAHGRRSVQRHGSRSGRRTGLRVDGAEGKPEGAHENVAFVTEPPRPPQLQGPSPRIRGLFYSDLLFHQHTEDVLRGLPEIDGHSIRHHHHGHALWLQEVGIGP